MHALDVDPVGPRRDRERVLLLARVADDRLLAQDADGLGNGVLGLDGQVDPVLAGQVLFVGE